MGKYLLWTFTAVVAIALWPVTLALGIVMALGILGLTVTQLRDGEDREE